MKDKRGQKWNMQICNSRNFLRTECFLQLITSVRFSYVNIELIRTQNRNHFGRDGIRMCMLGVADCAPTQHLGLT